ncbi:MAG: 4-coumarate--CoA ligase family protein [Bacteroidetes bacterium]|nr:4-coumarate--CoA ligase family protein [Rhodothermaceae bacterium RA]RMH53290.1 MAG: 4-coumarate--CoA ligase family protein [Bacteroidota bacterium]
MIYRSPYPDVEIPDLTLPDFVLHEAMKHPSKPALIDGPSGRTLTYGQLAGAVQQVVAGLHQRGFGKGDVFAIYSPNLPEYAIIFFAVAAVGGINTTINPLYTADELTHQLKDAGARYLITVPPFLDKAQEAAGRAGLEEVFVFGQAEGATPFTDLFRPDVMAPHVEIDPRRDLVVLPYSSGTTGLPKGVMLTHRNLVANILQTEAVEGLEPDETTIGILPFFHIYGMTVILSMALHQGATVVTMPKFELELFLRLIQEHRVRTLFLVPPIILALARHPLVDAYDLSSVETITSGAAPLPEPVARACSERLGCVVKQGYGMTETSPVTHFMPRDAARLTMTTVGLAVPNTEFRLVDPATGDDVAEGEPGELWIRGPQVMQGYLNNEAATRRTLDEEGWLHTGDIAQVDADGQLRIVDRVKELIKYKGFQVAPAELEAILQSHPAVADAAVIPSPDEEAGEVPKAFVQLKPGQSATEAELMDYVAERVAPHKKVRRVAFIDQIPKSASGKILRRELVRREREAMA